jgi:Domain of unknown function (DUF4350)
VAKWPNKWMLLPMPSTRKSDRLLLAALLTAAAIISLLTVLVAPPQRMGGKPRQRSTFFNTKDGTKAAYLSLERLGYSVDRLRRPIAEGLASDVRTLAVIEPVIPITDHEAEQLLIWVRDGGRLLLAPGSRIERYTPFRSATSATDDWFDWTVAPTPFSSEDPSGSEMEITPAESPEATDLLQGITKLTVGDNARFAKNVVATNGALADCPVTPLWRDDTGVIAAVVTCSAGEIIVLADTHALSNRGLAEADNALWLANLARRLQGEHDSATLVFDEYHAGFGQQVPSWIAIARLMVAEGWGPSVGQAVLVAFLWLFSRGVRFGRPSDFTLTRRRRRGEFAVAAGQLLHTARATDLAAETLRHHYHTRLCRAVGLPITTLDATLRAELTARGCAWHLERLSTGAKRRMGTGELLAACQHLEKELERLEHVK